VALREDEKQRLQANLGSKNCLMLRNHGLLTVGSTVAEAFVGMYVFESTCQIQISAQAGSELIMIDPKIMEGMPAVIDMTLKGQAADVTWSALVRELNRADPSYKT
jgi:ribulose-5-phosphate 4-epimerase/fuculose-1-phosphate aldolase